MKNKTDTGPRSLGPSLAAYERMRQVLEENKTERLRELDEAFRVAGHRQGKDERADEAKAFLSLVIKNIESYNSRVTVQNPETGEAMKMGWVELCGGTIRELDLDPQLLRLVYEYVASLLPHGEESLRNGLAAAAGMEKARPVSRGEIEVFKKKGIVAAFVAKLFVDSKVLTSDAATERAERYFARAVDQARAIQVSQYLTGRDRKFLDTCQRNFGGDLQALVDRQRKTVLANVKKRGEVSPVVEQALRHLLKGVFEARAVQDMDEWFEQAKGEFTPENYVYARLDEFRAELRERMAALESQPMKDPIGAAKGSARRTLGLMEQFNNRIGRSGVNIDLPPEGHFDLFQVLRDKAEDLGRDNVVDEFDRLISRGELLDTYAQYEVARFRKDEPSHRQRITADLFIWDEVYRSVPLNTDQRTRVEALRAEMSSYIDRLGRTIPGEVKQKEWIVPFAMGVFPLLRTGDEFRHFEGWVDRVRTVLDEATENSQPMRLEDLKKLEETHMGAAVMKPRQLPTDEWVPKLKDATIVDGLSAEAVRRRAARRRIREWRIWPWNWFKKKQG
jgi:hypothetical protein